jgi:hypothetical protein
LGGVGLPLFFYQSEEELYLMAKIIDLDVMVVEPIEFKIGGEVYVIPGSPSTSFLLKFMDFDQKRIAKKEPKAQIELLAEMTAMLLNQDENHNVDKSFMLDKLSFSQMVKIVEVFKESMRELENNPN